MPTCIAGGAKRGRQRPAGTPKNSRRGGVRTLAALLLSGDHQTPGTTPLGTGEKTMRTTITAGILGATITVLVATAAQAGTTTVRTPSIIPDADGYVYCKVDARSKRAIEIVARIVASDGSDVTEFGTGFRATPAATGDGRYYAEETAGSMHDGARWCSASVKNATRGDVHVTLTVYDASGNPVTTVEGN
jgi:hypothetical protein